MADAAAPEPGLFGDLLDRFTEIVGPAASAATFHFASLQEGMRLGQGYRPQDLPAALARIDRVLGHHSRVLADSRDGLRIGIRDSPLLASGNQVRQAVVRGLLEGLLRAVRGRPHQGRVVGDEGGMHVLEFVPEGRDAAA
jgi:hypothetical protein